MLTKKMILSKTLFDPALFSGLIPIAGQTAPFKMQWSDFLNQYLTIIYELEHDDYRYFAGKNSRPFPEPGIVLSSISFRILVSVSSGRIKEHKSIYGAYDVRTNTLVVCVDNIFRAAPSLSEFLETLKKTIRHEFCHANQAILAAPFFHRPEVIPPWKFPSERNQTSGEVRYLDFVYTLTNGNRHDLTHIEFPRNQTSTRIFFERVATDLRHLLYNPEAQLALRNLLQDYWGIRWACDQGEIKTKDLNKTLEKIEAAVAAGSTHCIDVHPAQMQYRNWDWPEKLSLPVAPLPLCIDHIANATVSGFSGKSRNGTESFLGDLHWVLDSLGRLPQSGWYHSTTPQELDAWLRMLLGRSLPDVFPNLESLRIANHHRAEQRNIRLAICQNPKTLGEKDECFKTIKDVYPTFALDYQERERYLRHGYADLCDYLDKPCLKEAIRESMDIDSSFPPFVQSIHPNYRLSILPPPLKAFRSLPSTDDQRMMPDNMCQLLLPPTTLDLVYDAMQRGAGMGVMRGMANAIGGKASWKSSFIFYSSYCLWDASQTYYSLQTHLGKGDDWSTVLQAGTRVCVNTAQLVATDLALSQAGCALQTLGDVLRSHGCDTAGKVVRKTGEAVGYATYAYGVASTWWASPTTLRTASQVALSAMSSMGCGRVAQCVTEKAGDFAGKMWCRFFGRTKQPMSGPMRAAPLTAEQYYKVCG